MGGRSLLLALLLSNIFWLIVFVTYTQHDVSPFDMYRVNMEAHLCPPCAAEGERSTADEQDTGAALSYSSQVYPSRDHAPPSDEEAESYDAGTARASDAPRVTVDAHEESGRRGRAVAAWSESWYNNGLLELPSTVGLRRVSGPGGEEYPLPSGTNLCGSAESDIVAYGFNAPEPDVIGILWPRDSRYRLMIVKHGLLGMAVLNDAGDEVATVVHVEAQEESGGSVNLLLRFAGTTAAGCDALVGVVEQPYPSWVLDFSFGFTASLDSNSPDSTRQALDNLSIILRRQRIHDYNFVHMLNPYTPRNGSHQEMELTVVHRSLEVAYNRAWAQGIRVLILAATFEEDVAMVHYPYQRPSRFLARYFSDTMGRKIPLMDDMLNLMWEDGPTHDTYIFTNADIAVIPDFYIDCWTVYRSDTAVPVLLREQLPLEEIDLTPPVNMEHLYTATATTGVKHTGDDCFLFPASLLANIDYGMVFPAYPPFACFLMQMLAEIDGGRYRLRSRSTFHLGVDTETSIWLNDPNTAIGRHVNNLNALAALNTKEHIDTLPVFIDKCRIMSWQMDRPMMQTSTRLRFQTPSQLLPSGEPGWYLGTVFPSSAYGRITYSASNASAHANRANTNIFSEELYDIMGHSARAMGMPHQPLMQRLYVGENNRLYPMEAPGPEGDFVWPPQGFEMMTAEERVKEIRELSNDRLWNSLPRDNQVIEDWMSHLGIPMPATPIQVLNPPPPLQSNLDPQFRDKSIDELVELLLAQAAEGTTLRLVECITPGMTGIPLLYDLLAQAEGVGGARELEPKMIGTYLSQVLSMPLEETLEARSSAKLPPLLSRWILAETPTFLDLNNMFVKTYADVVLQSPLVAVCREQVALGQEPSFVVEAVVLRRPLLELVWKQVQRGWFSTHSNTNQRGVWYYALEDIREPSFRVISTVSTLTGRTQSISADLHHIVGYNLDIEERSRRFIAEHLHDPCVRVHEVQVGDLATSRGAAALLDSLGMAAPPPHWSAEAHFQEFLAHEEELSVFRVSKATVEDEVTAFYRAYVDAGQTLPMVDLVWA